MPDVWIMSRWCSMMTTEAGRASTELKSLAVPLASGPKELMVDARCIGGWRDGSKFTDSD